jgi:predicted metal-dependent phosphoesterase TrpH
LSRLETPAAATLHPHLGEPRSAPGRWRVDCHVHTMWSGDSTTTPAELETAVKAARIDVLCLTDHSTVRGALRLKDELSCKVVVGQEQRTPDGELIGLFLTEAIPPGCRSARDVALAIRAQEGVVYVPHPFDPMRHFLREEVLDTLAADGLIDVIEVFNSKTSLQSLNERAGEKARELGLRRGAGSDAHVAEAIGAAFVEMAPFEGPADFLSSLEEAQSVGHFFDPPRPWAARVVPSTKN